MSDGDGDGDGDRTKWVALALALTAAVVWLTTLALRPKRAFYDCSDPQPVIAALVPADSALLHEETPGMFDGVCSSSFARSYATGASELEVTKSLAEAAEKLGFVRVPALPDSEWWCQPDRAKRFHQFVRGDLLLRFVVEPLPFRYGKAETLTFGQARYGVQVALRNYDQSRTIDCASP